MKQLLKRQLPLLFLIATLAYIIAGELQIKLLQLASKPLLMPLLIIWLCMHVSSSKRRNLILTALFFSCAGDVFLLLEYKNKMLFIPGLVSFLLTHILYIIYFVKLPGKEKSLLSSAPYVTVLVLGYGVALVMLLYPTLGTLKIPVIIYATVIMCMLLASLHVYRRVPQQVGRLFVAGAAFFVVSDSLLAINKFYTPLQFSFLVMVTYCLAQYFIVKGVILLENHEAVTPGR